MSQISTALPKLHKWPFKAIFGDVMVKSKVNCLTGRLMQNRQPWLILYDSNMNISH